MGYEITYLSVDNLGKIDLQELEDFINDNTCLITIMMANNEIGNLYPIKEIGKIAKKHNILFHCDAAQAVEKVKIDVKELGIKTLSLSVHKINAPKGIGVLYIENGVPFTPLLFGHQEKNRRGRTENVAYIIGLGKAEELMLMLESFNIFVSTGSACNSEIAEPFYVLTACNADLDNYSPIRVSLGKYNTKDEIDTFVKRLINIVNMIRKGG